MISYPLKVLPKNPGTEVNISRILQTIDFSNLEVEIEEIKEHKPEEVKLEGAKKIQARVSGRRNKIPTKIAEFSLKAQDKTRKRSWLGRSEESNKYAILVFDGKEASLVLTDHWYKFSPLNNVVKIQAEEEIKIGKAQRIRQEKQLVTEVFGEDSEEEVGKPRKKVHLTTIEEEEYGKEGMDFDEEFPDDEEDNEEEENKETKDSAALQHKLSNSGKEIQELLLETKSATSESGGDSSDIGLYDSEEELKEDKVTKQLVINELMRLGRVTLKELISECKKKFKNEGDWIESLTKIVREVTEIEGQGENAYVTLKEEHKRFKPAHAERIHFQTLK